MMSFVQKNLRTPINIIPHTTVHIKPHNCLNYNGMPEIMRKRSIIQGFWYFARSRSREMQVNPRNSAKFTKTQKIPHNSMDILSNTCLYNIFETYFSYRGYLLAVNLQIYLWTSSLKCKQSPKTTRRRLCCEKLGTSHDVKGLAIGSFLEDFLERIYCCWKSK